MAENSLLGKLDGLVSRFEEVGTLITDPAVIADMKRFVKLNKCGKWLVKSWIPATNVFPLWKQR